MPSQNNAPKARNWVFTLNNYEEADVERLLSDAFREDPAVKYVAFSKEEAPSTGTKHLQGFICFVNAQRRTTVSSKLPRCYVAIMKGRLEHSQQYIEKDDAKREGRWFEAGVAPKTQQEKGAGEKRRWAEAIDAAKNGRHEELESNFPDIYLKYYGTVQRIHQDHLKRAKLDDTEEKHLWLYGPAGTGKSRWARENYPDAFLKMCNKWWDGWDSSRHKVALIEDFDKNHNVLCHHMKLWADRYPFPAEIKGGGFKIRPDLVIVTSNYSPRDIWVTDNDLEPILRRFKIIRFSGNGVQTVEA